MGTVTDSNGDTYSTIVGWEAVVGYYSEEPPTVTGVASFEGGFTEDGIVLNAGDDYPFTITGNGSSITADDSSGNAFVINIGNSASIDHLSIISKVIGIEKGIQVDIGATHTVSLYRVSSSVGYNEGAANVYGFYQVTAPTGSTTNLTYCVADGVYDYGNNSAFGFYHSPPQSEEGEVNVSYCTATDIVTSGTNEAGGMHILASGSSGANLSHGIGASAGTAYCYSPHRTSNGIRYVGSDSDGVGAAGAQLLGQSSDRTGLPRGTHGDDYDIWKANHYTGEGSVWSGAGMFRASSTVGPFKVNGVRNDPYENNWPLDMSGMGNHGEYGAYTYKTRVPCPSNITAELGKLSISGVIPNNSVILFATTSYDNELDLTGVTCRSGVIDDIVLEEGTMYSDYHGYGDAMISSSLPRVHAYNQIIYMNNNTWGAAFAGYNMVRSHISSSGNVSVGISAANANRNSVHGLDNDHGFNTAIHRRRGMGPYSTVTFNSIANYKIKGITNAPWSGGVSETIKDFGNLIVQESGQLHPIDNYQQVYRSPNYGNNYYASGVSLNEFFVWPEFIGASFDSSYNATSTNTGNDYYLYSTNSSPPMLWNVPANYPEAWNDADEILADIPKAFEYCDINHNFLAVVGCSYYYSCSVSSTLWSIGRIDEWSNRFKPSVRGAAIDYGISERADENHGYGNSPIIAFIDF